MKGILKLLVIIILIIETCGCKDKKGADSSEKKSQSATRKAQMVKQEESDVNACKALISKIKAQPESANITSKIIKGESNVTADDFHKPSPLVSLEDFFEGNKDSGSIGCNLILHPGIPKFYEVLKGIRAKDNVQDVLIEISEIDEQYGIWPFSEIVYIITSASPKEVKKWMKPLKPDEIFEGWSSKKPPSVAPVLNKGMKVYAAWWD